MLLSFLPNFIIYYFLRGKFPPLFPIHGYHNSAHLLLIFQHSKTISQLYFSFVSFPLSFLLPVSSGHTFLWIKEATVPWTVLCHRQHEPHVDAGPSAPSVSLSSLPVLSFSFLHCCHIFNTLKKTRAPACSAFLLGINIAFFLWVVLKL